GDLERKLGDLAAARRAYDRALSIFEKLGDRWAIGRTMVDLAALAFEQGNHAEAYRILRQAIVFFRDLRNRRGIALALERFAEFAASRGDAKHAIRLAGAAGAIRHSIGAAVLNDGLKQARDLDAARIALGNAALDVEMDGWSMN